MDPKRRAPPRRRPSTSLTRLAAVAPTENEILTRGARAADRGDGRARAEHASTPRISAIERSASAEFDSSAGVTLVHGATLDVRSHDPTVFSIELPESERVLGNYRVDAARHGTRCRCSTARTADLDFTLRYTIEDIP